MSLKTDYKNAIPPEGGRCYRMVTNGDQTVTFTDETVYEQTGDAFGAADINATNAAVNALAQNVRLITEKGSGGGMFFKLPAGFTTQNCCVIAAYAGGYQYPFYATANSSDNTQMWVGTAMLNGTPFDKIAVQRFA